jgi:hypothetical protein
MPGIKVNVDNFVRAETDRMFGDILEGAGGVNRWGHNRQPTPLDQQTVIRMNRDTLYSFAVVNVSEGASVTVPESGGRYLSMMVLDQNHYVFSVHHGAGRYDLTGSPTPFVTVTVRILLDPNDEADLDEVHALQDQLAISATSEEPFQRSDYDRSSLDDTRSALLELGKGLGGYDRTFGRREEVDPVRHLIGTAGGWGGLPQTEAFYLNVSPDLPVGRYRLTVKDVPVDAFWSISLYNAEGFFETNDRNANSVNSITALPNDDGSFTVNFGGCDDDRPNCLPIMAGWNYIVRLYRPRSEILDGSWTFPGAEPV